MTTIPRKLRSFAFLIVALSLISAGAGGDQANAPPLKLDGKLVCIGASITVGEGVKPADCYVGLLKAKAKAENLNLEIIGQGRSGWSTGAYVHNEAKVVEAMPADATIVTILLGTNDCREEGSPEEVGERAAQNLGKLIDMYAAKAPHAQFIVISPTKCYPERLTKRLLDAHYGSSTPEKLKAITKGFEALAKGRGLRFIDLSAVPSSADNSIDGIHVKAAGHQQIFDAIWNCLSAAAPTTGP